MRGHTGPAGEYHYHEIIATRACHLSSNIIGYAFDGFPIYSNPGNVYKSGYEETGTPTTNSWDAYTHVGGSTDTIDRCNGITVDGQYRYYVTSTFPYILGCYAGTPEAQAGGAGPVARSSESFSGPNALARRVWQSGAVPNPPSVPQRPFTITRHGDTRVDSYYWLMNREDPEVLAHRGDGEQLPRRATRLPEAPRNEALRGGQEPHRRDRHLGPGAPKFVVVLRADPRRT